MQWFTPMRGMLYSSDNVRATKAPTCSGVPIPGPVVSTCASQLAALVASHAGCARPVVSRTAHQTSLPPPTPSTACPAPSPSRHSPLVNAIKSRSLILTPAFLTASPNTLVTHARWCRAVSEGRKPSPGGVMYVCRTFERTVTFVAPLGLGE